MSAAGRIGEGLGELDAEVFSAIASSPSPLLDATMRPLSAVADHSKLWMLIAAGLGASGRPSLQRGAVRGLATLAVTSLVANQVSKRIHPRVRPATDLVSLKRLRRQPTSSSFPSGHSASAAAFAIGVGVENRNAGYLLSGLAAAVGLSRVVTGAHYPGDVLAGFALGAGIAVLGSRLVPPLEDGRIIIPPPSVVDAPGRPNGEGLVILVNPASGDGTGERVLTRIREELPAAEIIELGEGDDIEQLAAGAASRAEVLGVGGGDGTVATVAAAALRAGKPLAVFPAGTFNHFAKDISCETVEHTVKAIRGGRVTRVDALWLNDEKLILNTSSIGAYPDYVRAREDYQQGLSRPAATARAALKVLTESDAVTVTVNGVPHSIAFSLIGNSVYGSPGFIPGRRVRLDDGLIDVRFLEEGHRLATVRLVLSLLSGRIQNSHIYQSMQVPELLIESDAPIRVAHDGEEGDETTRAHFRMRYRALMVYGKSVV